jgi:hypothetical protein
MQGRLSQREYKTSSHAAGLAAISLQSLPTQTDGVLQTSTKFTHPQNSCCNEYLVAASKEMKRSKPI